MTEQLKKQLAEVKELAKGCGKDFCLFPGSKYDIIYYCGETKIEGYKVFCENCKQKLKTHLESLGDIGYPEVINVFPDEKGFGDLIYCGDERYGFCPKCQIKQEIKQICESVL